MRSVLPLVLALTACGRVGFDRASGDASSGDDDAAVDALAPDAAPCTAFGPWATPQRDTTLSSTLYTEWGPHLTPDGLSIVFASDRAGNHDIYLATRTTPTGAFGAPAMLYGPAGDQLDPWISNNLDALVHGNNGIRVVVRASPQDAWGASQVLLPSSGTNYSNASGPDLSPDVLRIYFTADRISDGRQLMWEASRPNGSSAFGAATAIAPLVNDIAFGSARGDDLELVYQSGGAGADLFSSTRPTPAAAFGTGQPIAIVNTASDEVDADLSDDGKTLWYASNAAGTWDLYVTTRSCN